MERFLEWVKVADLKAATRGRQLLFEGAQGLLLDQDRGFFPHVTRSNTGLRNALALAAELDLTELEVTYVTRPYTTRHGAGPLPHELPEKPYPGIVDATNLPNDWQGVSRFGWLDLSVLKDAIVRDLQEVRRLPGLTAKPRLAVTCLDQIGSDKARYYSRGLAHQASVDELIGAMVEAVSAAKVLLGFGLERHSTTFRARTAFVPVGMDHVKI